VRPRIHDAELLYNRAVAAGMFRMRVRCASVARQARPGQFIMLQVSGHADPLLRRPFSICGRDGETFDLLYRVAGRGTAIMTAWAAQQAVNCIGPLGRGFTIPDGLETAFLVAGGIGIAPLLFLLQELDQQHVTGNKIFLGAKTADAVRLLEDFKPLPADISIATEDGTAGFCGLVTDSFADYIEKIPKKNLKHSVVFSCGPQAMAQAVSSVASRLSIECQLSLEAIMACGIGACLGCAVKTRTVIADDQAEPLERGSRPFQYLRICAEGPVFDSRELVWDEG
jgi:dihydroorotate dehydrogenase electron transfer subunit